MLLSSLYTFATVAVHFVKETFGFSTLLGSFDGRLHLVRALAFIYSCLTRFLQWNVAVGRLLQSLYDAAATYRCCEYFVADAASHQFCPRGQIFITQVTHWVVHLSKYGFAILTEGLWRRRWHTTRSYFLYIYSLISYVHASHPTCWYFLLS